MINPISALSPLDGRYAATAEPLRPIFSEYGLMKARVRVELEWLKALAAAPQIREVPPFSADTLAEIDRVIAGFDLENAAEVKAIEATTNHDVKAIEYWLKNRTMPKSPPSTNLSTSPAPPKTSTTCRTRSCCGRRATK